MKKCEIIFLAVFFFYGSHLHSLLLYAILPGVSMKDDCGSFGIFLKGREESPSFVGQDAG